MRSAGVLNDLRGAVRGLLGQSGVARAKRWLAPLCFGDLTRLGRWYGTNKASSKQLYTPLYELHLARMRRRHLRLLEIGIGGYGAGPQSGGASLRMWRSWMPHAEVVGIDIEPRMFDEPRISTYTGDQSDEVFLCDVCRRAGPFDIVIDDGSHRSEHVVASFQVLWALLEPGGVYVIEDLGTSYLSEFGGGPPGTPGTTVEMVKGLLDSPTLGDDVAAVHMHPHIVFIEKSRVTPGSVNRERCRSSGERRPC